MNIKKIKLLLEDNLNKTIHFKINGSRNQVQEFFGEIVGVYQSVFLIKPNGTNVIQSFSYSDVLTKNVEITF